MSRRSELDPALGGLSQKDVLLFSIAFMAPILVGVIWGIAEPAFFTWIAVQYNYELNYAILWNHFSPLCLLMGASFFLVAFLPTLINLVQVGWTPRTQILFVAGLLGAIMAILVEDAVAHLRYGQLPADDWTHWFLPALIQVKANFWIPTWYFIVAIFVTSIFVWFTWFYIADRRIGGRRTG